jgi:hypothetical protein
MSGMRSADERTRRVGSTAEGRKETARVDVGEGVQDARR